jgi:hypothetical protein
MARADDEATEKPKRPTPGWGAWLADPRTAVLGFLGSALLIGGGRKVWQGIQARRAVAALGMPDVRPEEVMAAANHGREGVMELFRLLGPDGKPTPKGAGPAWTDFADNELPPHAKATPREVRAAAGRALSVLWAKDDLIVEEEKALVRRGFAVDWKARRRYPRALRVPIPFEVSFGVPFLVDGGPGVGPSSLEWSHRVLGAGRASLEMPSPWVKGSGLARFEVEPSDFATLGPHRLALASKVRVVGLTDDWEIELPHLPFSFDFDPILTVGALLTTEDAPRAEAFARSVGLSSPRESPESDVLPLDLTPDLVLRDPPALVVSTPLPCDLAHQIHLEIEGVPGRFRAGSVVIGGQDSGLGTRDSRAFPIGPISGLPPDAVDRPGERRIRLVLTADPELGWTDPDVRSVWPGTLTTDWAEVRVIRR